MNAALPATVTLPEEAIEAIAQRAAEIVLQRQAPDDEWMDAKRAAAYLGVTANALHKKTAAREIPFEQDGAGAKLWFKRSDLDRWRRGGSVRGLAR